MFVCLVLAVPAAIAKPFWHDEIFTILMSGLPSSHAIWQAGLDGVDLSPPLNLWLTRAVHAVAGVGPVSTRVPALIGFGLSVVIVFRLLLRRIGPIGALAGALIPFLTAGFRYSYEARAYGMMMGLSSVALYCWMEAAAGRRRRLNLPLLATALAASIWNHYYGVLVFAPVLAGELVRVLRTRQFDPGVLVAMAASAAGALPLYPLAAAASAHSPTFWAPASRAGPGETYQYLLNATLNPTFAIAGAAIVLLLAAAHLLRAGASTPPRKLEAHEMAAVAAAAAIPLVALALGRLATGVFVPRYGLSAIAGLSLLVPLLVWRLNTRRTPAELVLCLTLAYVVGGSVVAAARRPLPQPADPVADRAVLLGSLRAPQPTVVSSSLQFAQLWFYTPPELKPRLRYLVDPERALQWSGSDTLDRGYLALARWRRVPVEDYGEFVARYPSFRVYEAGSGWLLDQLRDRGALVEEVERETGGRLYLITMPADRPVD